MKFSRIQMIWSGSWIVGLIIIILSLIIPLVSGIYDSTSTVFTVLRSSNLKDRIDSLYKEKEFLEGAHKQVRTLANGSHGSSHWYNFLITCLRDNRIEAKKINASGLKITDAFQYEQYSFTCQSDFHSVGKLCSSLENGPYICSINSMHLVSRSLIKSGLNVSLSVTFYSKGRNEIKAVSIQ